MRASATTPAEFSLRRVAALIEGVIAALIEGVIAALIEGVTAANMHRHLCGPKEQTPKNVRFAHPARPQIMEFNDLEWDGLNWKEMAWN